MSIFKNVLFNKPKRNVFDLTHEVKLTGRFGQLIPFYLQEVVPGDSFQNSSESLVRAAPMLAPLMHRVNVYTHFFFVPNRLVWDDWEEFITGGEDGTSNPVFPYKDIVSGDRAPGTLADYLRITSEGSASVRVSALPFRAYNLIWNEYYRDQNLQDELPISLDSGLDTITPIALLNRCWEKDYFTSALPFTQRGPEAVIPIADSANVVLSDDSIAGKWRSSNGGGLISDASELQIGKVGSSPQMPGTLSAANSAGTRFGDFVYDPNGSLSADLSNATSTTINELRRAVALQRWLENNARGGARYIEQIFAHFGVKSSDARLQRPEFLGGGKSALNISEVLQTSQSTADSDLADMAGHGISVGVSNSFRKFFEEHGFIIGIMSIMPRTGYVSGTLRSLQKFDRFDYYFPEFSLLGEQPVWNSEIYTGNGEQSGTFGYQSRYAEYKYTPSTVHGEFKDSLLYWHLARKFQNKPQLNEEFVECDSDLEDLSRIFPVQDDVAQFYVQIINKTKAVRPMPKFVIPSL